MNRARLIVSEVTIQKQGEISFFQIRLPKDALSILGIETDVFMESVLETAAPPIGATGGTKPDGTVGTPIVISRTPFLKWNSTGNPIVCKLKLQNRDRNNIFFENWIPFVFLNSSMPDMSYGLFPKSPYSLIVISNPKRIGIPCTSSLINGMILDGIGIQKNLDIKYRVKVFVWIETAETANGVVFDFQKNKKELEIKL